MNKSELVHEIAVRTNIAPSQVAEVTESLIQVVTQTVVRGDKVVLSGFGTFYRKARGRRTARNILADEPVTVPATNIPAFRPGKPFKEAVGRRRRPRIRRTR